MTVNSNLLTLHFFFSDPIAKCLSEGDVYRSDRYKPLYSLVTHSEKRPTTELFNVAMSAACIVYGMITKTTFFGKIACFSDVYQNVDVVFVSGLVLRHYLLNQVNDHEVCRNTIFRYEITFYVFYFHCHSQYSELRNGMNYSLGVSVQPFLSLINHSCTPSVGRCPSMGSTALFALHPIERNTQVRK